MKRLLTLIASIVALGVASAGADPDAASPPPLTPETQNGVKFMTGGVSDSEQAKLRELGDAYNLRVALTNAEGAYLSDVDVVIEDASGKILLEANTRGPILLARLEPGRYHLKAMQEGRTTERRTVDVPRQEDQVRLYVALVE